MNSMDKPNTLMIFSGEAAELLHEMMQARYDVPPKVERKRKRIAKQQTEQLAA